ncbi:MAG: hypothetical protein M1832_001351, partial [Thelocarpon impressellum]
MKSSPDQQDALALKQWIAEGGSSVSASADVTNHAVGFAETLYQACLELFAQLWREILATPRWPADRPKDVLKQSLGRLYLWGEGFEQGRLDKCLEHSDDLRDDVLDLLTEIGTALAN